MERRDPTRRGVKAPDGSAYHAPDPQEPPTSQPVPRTPPIAPATDATAVGPGGVAPPASSPGIPAFTAPRRNAPAFHASVVSGSGLPEIRVNELPVVAVPRARFFVPGSVATVDLGGFPAGPSTLPQRTDVGSTRTGGGEMAPPDSVATGGGPTRNPRRPIVPSDSRDATGVMMPDGTKEGFGLGFVKVDVDAKLLKKMTKKEAIAKFVKRLNDDLHRGDPDPNPDIDFDVDPATDELKLVYNDKAKPPENKGKSVDGSKLGKHMKELARLLDDPKNTTKIMLVANDTKLDPKKTGAKKDDKVFVPTALDLEHVAYVNIEAIEQYEKLGPDAWKGLKADPMNLVAGIYQELRQDERIRNDKSGDDKKTKYRRADNETSFDTNDLLKELSVPYHPVKAREDGTKYVDRGGWWHWSPLDKKWMAEEDFPAPGIPAYASWEKFMKEHPEADSEGGYDPKTGILLATNWQDPSDGAQVFVQYLQGDGDGNILRHPLIADLR